MESGTSTSPVPEGAPSAPLHSPAILAERIEQRIEVTYNTNGLTKNEAERVQDVLHRVFDQFEATSDD